MKTAFRTDVGQVRTINEDRAVIERLPGGIVLAVLADGMGGHQAGDVASQTAVDLVVQALAGQEQDLPAGEQEKRLRAAIVAANADIYARSISRPELAGMGTTLVVALAGPERGVIAHVGDSRAYLLRSGQLDRLTEDHSLVNELVRSGQISPEEAEGHPRRNVLTRAVGTEPDVVPDMHEWVWSPGDTLLLCTDGLTNMMSEAAISGLLQETDDVEAVADKLLEAALAAGGDDNITVIVVRNEQDDGGGGTDQ